MKRRTFLGLTTLAFPAILSAQSPAKKVRIAVIGMGGRGTSHAVTLAKLANVEITHVCDPDEKRTASAASAVNKASGQSPVSVRDFRKVLDDSSVDAVSIATPNHWHAPAALLAMSAGKHIYLEKPCSHDDDQETPDTNTAAFDFTTPGGPVTITWECRSWMNKTPLDPQHDVAFYAEKGTLLISGSGYTIHDPKGVKTSEGKGSGGDVEHFQNFIDAIRDGAKLNAEIEEGHKSTLLCHLGNSAYRTGDAKKLWKREYRAGWEPTV